jgi:hypothetical protein
MTDQKNKNQDEKNHQIIQYLNNELSDSEKHELESDDFTSDALEGLSEMNQKKIEINLVELKKKLKKQTVKNRRKSKTIGSHSIINIYATLMIIFILAVLGYFIITKLLG